MHKQRPFSRPLACALVVLAGALFSTACQTSVSEKPEGPTDLRVELAEPDFGYQIRSAPHVVKAGTEVLMCDVVKISPKDGERLIWLNEFESRTSLYTHHMNVMVGLFSVGDLLFGEGKGAAMLGLEEGQYDCDELGDLMEEQGAQVVYPSQNTHQKGRLPDGVAVPAVVPLVMVMQHHYINTGDEDLLVDARVNLHRAEEDSVEHVATGFFGGTEVDLPPFSQRVVANTCAISRDLELFAISSHSHERGSCFTMNYYDGESQKIDDEPLFVNDDWESPPILFFEQEEWTGNRTLAMKAGDGIHWACHYRNNEDRHVYDGGSADDEMCIFVGVGYPSKVTVGDVKKIVDEFSIDALQSATENAIVPCDPVTDATSPWPGANEVYDLSDAAGESTACLDFPVTGRD